MNKKRLISYLGRRLVIHISTFLMVTLAVLAACHLSFAALAVLVDAATFTGTLEKGEVSVTTAFLRWNRWCTWWQRQPVGLYRRNGRSIWADAEEPALQLSHGSQQHNPAASSSHLPAGGLRTRAVVSLSCLCMITERISSPQLLSFSLTLCVLSRVFWDATRPLLHRCHPHWVTSAPRCWWWYSVAP